MSVDYVVSFRPLVFYERGLILLPLESRIFIWSHSLFVKTFHCVLRIFLSHHPDFYRHIPPSVFPDAVTHTNIPPLWWVWWLHWCLCPSWGWVGRVDSLDPCMHPRSRCVCCHLFLFHHRGLCSCSPDLLCYSFRRCIYLCCICCRLPTSRPFPDNDVRSTG